MIDDIRIDINKDKVNKEYKKVFNKLNKLIIDISTNKNEEKDSVERLEKSISDLEQLRKKQKTDFQNKMIRVVYQFFNTLGFNEEFEHYLAKKKNQSRLKKKNQSRLKRSLIICKNLHGLIFLMKITTH